MLHMQSMYIKITSNLDVNLQNVFFFITLQNVIKVSCAWHSSAVKYYAIYKQLIYNY